MVENYDEDYLIVTFKMARLEAIQLCFLYRSNMRIISPPDLREKVIDELLLLQSTYLKQKIQTNI
ncbi:WYL domain-containing protein [Staphylococcus xylosus]|uniref:WYL domain-containing protein n=1 Tax=Staphylococcus xylosus TaxID=1288 RepID=UPI001F466FA9|nr:WYL domain-containing protein [Staphylococcus xylosus]MCE7781356.1 WYL domain-containing protein [Staphylococcus xylosus]